MNFKSYLKKNTTLVENFETEYQELNEAVFKKENIARVMQLYKRLLGKYFMGEFKIFCEEEYKKAGEKGTGIRLINDLNYQIRFNWKFADSNDLLKQNKADKTKLFISSIDYWEPTNLDFEKPSTTITFLKQINVIQIWKGLTKIIKKGIRGKYTLNDLKVEIEDLQETNKLGSSKLETSLLKTSLLEDLSWDQRNEFLKKNGFKSSLAQAKSGKNEFNALIGDNPELKQKLDEYILEVSAGKKETNSTGKKLKDADNLLSQTLYCDPELVFQDIEDLTKFIAKGRAKSLIICGDPGVGKTFTIMETLKKELGASGGSWHYHSGAKASAVSFYITTFRERNEIIVWDEADSILKNDDIVMMLKPALDTSGDNAFEYTRGYSMSGKSKGEIEDYCNFVDEQASKGKIIAPQPTKGDYVQVPGKYYFKGQMIFISNMPASKLESAILSRSLYIDLKLSAQDTHKRIMSIMKSKYKDKTMQELDEFAEALGGFSTSSKERVEYMTPEYMRKIKPLTIRSMVLAVELKEAGLKNWARLASLYA